MTGTWREASQEDLSRFARPEATNSYQHVGWWGCRACTKQEEQGMREEGGGRREEGGGRRVLGGGRRGGGRREEGWIANLVVAWIVKGAENVGRQI